MLNEYGFFSSQNDRKYSADDFCNVFNDFFTTGILLNDSDNFAVDILSGLNLTVKMGTAYIKGHYFRPNSATNIEISPNYSDDSRYSLVVLRLDFITRSIFIKVSDGNSAQNPVYPELCRDDSAYEIAIASVKIAPNQTELNLADITDLRGFNEYCGFVTGAVNQINTSTLYSQFKNEWGLLKAVVNDDADGILQRWAELGNVKTVNDVLPDDDYNVNITMDNIPSGENFKRLTVQTGALVGHGLGKHLTVTFPNPFKETPAVSITYKNTSDMSDTDSAIAIDDISTSGFTCHIESNEGIYWLAIGDIEDLEVN